VYRHLGAHDANRWGPCKAYGTHMTRRISPIGPISPIRRQAFIPIMHVDAETRLLAPSS
jgi:hypothetical protein